MADDRDRRLLVGGIGRGMPIQQKSQASQSSDEQPPPPSALVRQRHQGDENHSRFNKPPTTTTRDQKGRPGGIDERFKGFGPFAGTEQHAEFPGEEQRADRRKQGQQNNWKEWKDKREQGVGFDSRQREPNRENRDFGHGQSARRQYQDVREGKGQEFGAAAWGHGGGGGGHGEGYDGGGRDHRGNSGFGRRNNGCYNCGEEGHISRDCLQPRKERGADDRMAYQGQSALVDMTKPPPHMGQMGSNNEMVSQSQWDNSGGTSHRFSHHRNTPYQQQTETAAPQSTQYLLPNAGFGGGKTAYQNQSFDNTLTTLHRGPKRNAPPGGYTCFNCQEQGHMQNQCPNPPKVDQQQMGYQGPPERTSFSPSSGYGYTNTAQNMRMGSPDFVPVGRGAHQQAERKPHEGEWQDRKSGYSHRCRHCNEEGHFRKNCPKLMEQHDRQDPVAPLGQSYAQAAPISAEPMAPRLRIIRCFACNEEGHLSRMCPKKFEQSGHQEDTAGATGHTAIDYLQFPSLQEAAVVKPPPMPRPTGRRHAQQQQQPQLDPDSDSDVIPMASIPSAQAIKRDQSKDLLPPGEGSRQSSRDVSIERTGEHRGNRDEGRQGKREKKRRDEPKLGDKRDEHKSKKAAAREERKKARPSMEEIFGNVAAPSSKLPNAALRDAALPIVDDSMPPQKFAGLSPVKHDIVLVDQCGIKQELERLIMKGGENYKADVRCKCGSAKTCSCRKKMVVLMKKRMTAEILKSRLGTLNVQTMIIHGDMPISERRLMSAKFKFGKPGGILLLIESESENVDEIFDVANWIVFSTIPESIDEYKKRVALATRDGSQLLVTSLYDALVNWPLVDELIEMFRAAGSTVPGWLIAQGTKESSGGGESKGGM